MGLGPGIGRPRSSILASPVYMIMYRSRLASDYDGASDSGVVEVDRVSLLGKQDHHGPVFCPFSRSFTCLK